MGYYRQTELDQGQNRWFNEKAFYGQDAQIQLDHTTPAITHGVGGTWTVAVIGPTDPNDGTSAKDAIDADVVAFMDQVAAYAQVIVQYEFSQNTVPSGYEVIVVTKDAVATDINAWGSLALIGTPIVHALPLSWQQAEFTDVNPVSVNSATIDSLSNAAFEISGAPQTGVTFGDGGVVTTAGNLAANIVAGHIAVGDSPSAGEIVIAAIPTGTTYQDTNNSTVRHVMWGTDIGDPDALAAIVWETFGDAILWTRKV